MLAKFGLKSAHIITGLIAGAMGLVFNRRPRTLREKIKAYVVVICGAVLTGYLTPLVILKWEWLSHTEYSVAFIVGLFGMGGVQAMFNLLNRLKANPIPTLKSIREIFKG